MRLSQRYMIERHLLDYGKITSWEAFMEYGITRLSAVIYILRDCGYSIESKPKHTKNRYGNSTNFVEYILDKNSSIIEKYGYNEIETPISRLRGNK